MTAVRVIVADDHPVFLDGLQLLLDSTPGITVVGSAADGQQLVEVARGTDYDVAVIDFEMPGLDGPGATRALLEDRPAVAVLMLTMHDDEASVTRALRAGARGYLLKGAGHGAIARGIVAVAEGDTVLGGPVGARVVAAATSSRRAPEFPNLSAREAEILELVARGLANPAIAAELFLSVKTVQNQVSNLLTKTGATTRAELVARARDTGMGGPGGRPGPP